MEQKRKPLVWTLLEHWLVREIKLKASSGLICKQHERLSPEADVFSPYSQFSSPPLLCAASYRVTDDICVCVGGWVCVCSHCIQNFSEFGMNSFPCAQSTILLDSVLGTDLFGKSIWLMNKKKKPDPFKGSYLALFHRWHILNPLSVILYVLIIRRLG